MDLYLASASPRRRELLAQIGVAFERIAAPVDETPLLNEDPHGYVLRLARAKAQAGWLALQSQGLPPHPVLAADTTVVLDGELLGKPDDANHASQMLRRLSGGTHLVLTALAVTEQDKVETVLSESRVTFMPLSDAQIAAYVASGEPMDKAGAYGIQGRAGLFVAHLEGSFTGVVGLPLHETAQLLARWGLGALA
ncbi:Maf family protein [Chitiniphilus eburneus]|uniref:dTTP/UTP pyrophosphatase n=1 Tax=Chitiniphilus eburneus TaxID=2571148 RepID=A0A4U0Q808_9NEIS|nr:Maf family protein [Chitiniphilus eburneus]TJZ77393.1 septum formation inhibitor Maf [Chitiniphilus eburneus]